MYLKCTQRCANLTRQRTVFWKVKKQ